MLKLEIELMYRDLHQNIFELILKIFASSFFIIMHLLMILILFHFGQIQVLK
jgi:hypothetical protein